jgi:hypothetical protein
MAAEAKGIRSFGCGGRWILEVERHGEDERVKGEQVRNREVVNY